MRLTKFGHACARIDAGARIVLDPGTFSGEHLLDGADAVLITHEHFDHLDTAAVLAAGRVNPRLTVWTTAGAAAQLTELGERVHTVHTGDTFDVGGLGVRVIGERHWPNHPDQPPPDNVGFLLGGELYYPGDALTVPDTEVGTLLVPSNAPWMRLSDLVTYLRSVRPQRAYSTHDGLLNEVGLSLVDRWLAGLGEGQGGDFRRIPPGGHVDLPS